MGTTEKALLADDHRQGLRVLGAFVAVYLAVYVVTLVLGVGPNMLMRGLGVGDDARILIGSTISRSGVLAAGGLWYRWCVEVEGGRRWGFCFRRPRDRGCELWGGDRGFEPTRCTRCWRVGLSIKEVR